MSLLKKSKAMTDFASDLSFAYMQPMKHYKLKGGADGSNGAIIAIVVVIIVILLVAIILAACWSGCGTETIYVTGPDGQPVRMKVSKKALRGKALRDLPPDTPRRRSGKTYEAGGLSDMPPDTPRRRSGKTYELASEAEARELLGGSQPAMVFTYMNGCGFCDKAKMYYNDSFAAEHPHVTLAMIEASKCQDLCKEKGITGFPTFLTNFDAGMHVGYKPKEVMSKILKAAQPKAAHMRMNTSAHGKVHELVDANHAREALQQKQKTVLFVYAPWCGFCKKQKPVLDQLAAKHKNVKFLAINADEAGKPITSAMKIDGFPAFLTNMGRGAHGKPQLHVGYKDGSALEQALGL